MKYIKQTIIAFLILTLAITALSCKKEKQIIDFIEAMNDMKNEYAQFINYRQYLINANHKIKEDKELSVLFFGGSLTEGHGATDKAKYSWRGRTCQWFEETFPNVNFKFYNKSVGESGTFLGVYRLKLDVIDLAPDVVFLEYSINDRYFGSSYDESFARCETIVREIKEALPNTEIIMLITTDADCLKDNIQGKLHTQGQAHEDVAKAYDISTLHVGMLLAKESYYSKEVFKNKYAIDVVHLNDEGYEIYYKCVEEYLENSLLKTDFAKVAAANRDFPQISEKLFDGNRKHIQPTAELLAFSEQSGGSGVVYENKKYTGNSSSNGILKLSENGVFVFEFTGTEAAMWCTLKNKEFLVSVDGAEYMTKTATEHNPAIIANNLEAKSHIIKIKVSSKENCFTIGALFTRDDTLATVK